MKERYFVERRYFERTHRVEKIMGGHYYSTEDDSDYAIKDLENRGKVIATTDNAKTAKWCCDLFNRHNEGKS